MKAIDENAQVSDDDDDDENALRTTTNPVGTTATTDGDTTKLASIVGILYGRSVRSGYACLHLYCPPQEDPKNDCDDTGPVNDDDKSLSEGDTVLIRLQFMMNSDNDDDDDKEQIPLQQPVQLRSHIRRFCKPGDLLHIQTQSKAAVTLQWREVGNEIDTAWQDLRLVINVATIQQALQVLQVKQRRFWSMKQIQACQEQFCGRGGGGASYQEDPSRLAPLLAPTKQSTSMQNENNIGNENAKTYPHHHGGLLKRTQGEYLRNFLAHMILRKLSGSSSSVDSDSDDWATTNVTPSDMVLVRQYLNQGSGVLDVAGGSGHVSMALGLQGIQSTIVDPRDKVGHLPGRDRKTWNRAWKRIREGNTPVDDKNATNNSNISEQLYCQPVQYNVYRAWFGTPPEVRYDDQVHLPVCGAENNDNDSNQLLTNCRAIAALHPDEATDAIVDTAVQKRIPFVIVPCCVFYRLFPNRRMPNNVDMPVSTYEDLLDYLQAKDESIQRTLLPFEGANTLLWSIF